SKGGSRRVQEKKGRASNMDESIDTYHGLYQQDTHLRAGNQRKAAVVVGEPQAVSIADSLPLMMYGFGDEEHPLPETVACMQQLVGEYIRHVTDEACKAAEVKGKLDTECFMFAVRDDKAKFKRVRQLLDTNAHMRNCTRLRFVDDNLFTVFHPSFPPHPKVRAVVPLPRLSATPTAADLGLEELAHSPPVV
ncbi:unnamed protein product, partial [Pylaiella littoralis]